AAPTDDTKAARSPRDRPRQIPARPGRVPRQMRRSPGPDCPRRSSLPGTPEITSSARDQPPQRSASSDPPAYRARILPRESKQAIRFYTAWVMNYLADTTAGAAAYLRYGHEVRDRRNRDGPTGGIPRLSSVILALYV